MHPISHSTVCKYFGINHLISPVGVPCPPDLTTARLTNHLERGPRECLNGIHTVDLVHSSLGIPRGPAPTIGVGVG